MNIELPPIQSFHLQEKKSGEATDTLAPPIEWKGKVEVKVGSEKYNVYWVHKQQDIELHVDKFKTGFPFILMFCFLWGVFIFVWLAIKLWRWLQ